MRNLLALLVLFILCPSGSAQEMLYKRSGSLPFGFFGLKIAGVGDVDQDGIEDWIAGNGGRAPYWFQDGQALVYSGASGALLFTLTGGPGEDGFGTTIDAAGDVNADGYPDFLVGAMADTRYAPHLGSAWVFSGKTGGVLYEWPGTGDDQGSQGWAVAAAGDVNLDGYDDVAITEEGHGSGSTYLRIYSGKDGSVLREISDTHWGGFAVELENLGDVNSDGYPDLAVATPWGGALKYQGVVVVLSGLDGAPLYRVHGSKQHALLGTAITSLEDIDGDGVPDLALGAPGGGTIDGGTPGRVQVHSGATGALIWSKGPAPLLSVGHSVAAIGDLNGDGLGEVIVGAPHAGSGHVRVLSGADGKSLIHWTTGGFYPGYGFSLAGLGDLDGDGFDDLAISLPYRLEGVVQVFSSRTLIGQSYCGPANLNSTGAPAWLSAHGSEQALDGDLVLRAGGLPVGQATMFLVSDTQGFSAAFGGGQGNLCLSGQLGRFRDQVRPAPPSGLVIERIDLSALPLAPPHQVAPGETWNFQAWYRDDNPASTSNLTDAISVTFQ